MDKNTLHSPPPQTLLAHLSPLCQLSHNSRARRCQHKTAAATNFCKYHQIQNLTILVFCRPELLDINTVFLFQICCNFYLDFSQDWSTRFIPKSFRDVFEGKLRDKMSEYLTEYPRYPRLNYFSITEFSQHFPRETVNVATCVFFKRCLKIS